MSLFGGGATNSNTPMMLLGYRAQTSLYGTCIVIPYGLNRVTPNVLWTGGWDPQPVNSGGKLAKASSKGGGGSGQSFDYKTDIILGLGQGPSAGILRAWMDRNTLAVAGTSESHTVPVGGAITPTNQIGRAHV